MRLRQRNQQRDDVLRRRLCADDALLLAIGHQLDQPVIKALDDTKQADIALELQNEILLADLGAELYGLLEIGIGQKPDALKIIFRPDKVRVALLKVAFDALQLVRQNVSFFRKGKIKRGAGDTGSFADVLDEYVIEAAAANFKRSPDQAEQQLEEGYQDIIGSARSFICDPEWVKKVEEGRPDEICRCIGCLHCIESFTNNAGVNISAGLPGKCALNPAVGFERETAALPRDGAGREVIVVGAGPAGLKAAEQLARRGFRVTVLEKADVPGGQVNTASSCLHKDKLHWSVEDLMTSVKKLGVDVQFGTEATADSIAEKATYAVIVATGGTAAVPKAIRGSDLPHVCTAPDIILGRKQPTDQDVIVAGSGMTGLETVEVLNANGNRVTVIEMADTIAPGTWFQLVDDEMSRIQGHGTKMYIGKRLMKILPDRVIVEDVKTAELQEIKADQVVLSLGVRPENGLYQQLKTRIPRVYLVGDAAGSGTISDAVHSAWDPAKEIH